MTTKSTGDWGEDQVATYLQEQGYVLLERQWRCRYGEIDLIAKKDGILCFVEVKLRKGSTGYGLPREAVTAQKQQKLRTAATLFFSHHPVDCPARFDVAEVYADGKSTRIVYLENAFE